MRKIKVIFLILLSTVSISSCKLPGHKIVCFKGVCVDSEVADTDQERTRGLMYRDGLKEGKAMLFIFETPSIYSFWMKNMRFSLDIIWISADKKIVDIKVDVPPCRGDICDNLIPSGAAKFVLEVPAGFARKHGIKVNDIVTIR